jgi:replicative DNA helicase
MHSPEPPPIIDDRPYRSSSGPSGTSRVPPQDLDAERAVLGSILIHNDAVFTALEELTPEDFYRPAHQLIMRAMTELATKSEPVDTVTLSAVLKAKSELEAAGGLAAIVSLSTAVPTAANVKYYADIVRKKSTLRKLIGTATEIVTQAYDAPDPDVVVDDAERKVFEVCQTKARQGITRIDKVVAEAFRRIEKLAEQKKDITGVATGINDLDNMTAGLQPSDLVIVAGRPSMGKCLAADSELVLEDGSIATIEAIHRARTARLLTLNDRFKLELTSPSAFVDDGEKPVFRVTTRLGRTIETTATHPFLTIEGWRPLGELASGARIAVPRVARVRTRGAARGGGEARRLSARRRLSHGQLDHLHQLQSTRARRLRRVRA